MREFHDVRVGFLIRVSAPFMQNHPRFGAHNSGHLQDIVGSSWGESANGKDDLRPS